MAYQVTQADGFNRTTSLPSGTNFSACGWAQTSNTGLNESPFGIQGSGWYCEYFHTGNVATVSTNATNNVVFTGSASPAANTWYFWGVTCSGTTSTSVTGYLGRLTDTTLLTNAASGSGFGVATIMNAAFAGSEGLKGRIGNYKIWDAVLSASEMEAERRHQLPARWLNLHLWSPFLGSPKDYSNNGRNWGTDGSPVVVPDGPPVSWGGRVLPTYDPRYAYAYPIKDIRRQNWVPVP